MPYGKLNEPIVVRCVDCGVDVLRDCAAPRKRCQECSLNLSRQRRRRASRAWAERHPARKRDSNRKRYGLSRGEFARILESQDGRCRVCLEIPDAALYVDHDHRTGVVRGLLCASCNVALGHFDDDPRRLRRAVAYLGTVA